MANSNSSSNTVTSIAANGSISAGSSIVSVPINPYYYSYSSGTCDDSESTKKAQQKSSNIELHLLNG